MSGIEMQPDEELDFRLIILLIFVVLCLGVLICVYNITRPRGISNAFNNAEGARQDMTEAEVRFEQITSAFNNDKNGIQNHRRARIGRGESSRAANSETVNQEVLQIKNVLAKLIAYLFGEKNQFNNKDKSN
ncbi:uncharacterized protein HKW66_Vig0193010 [Vigna angularis]|uniref:Uncharacterized protein n=2 Tax=Phaseolus angularis TaxID=3914 RepID=A0A8T0KTP7_PHAAN|nr:uncharacterized protein LOC108325774 [Vigna angularis]KAG2401663.1 uncharacterized protein HKW66_Vig0193010 [Vigna angularis]BAT94324.1 hypothetical protein VIGAN_08091900 [Vigna angularis var. angularis]